MTLVAHPSANPNYPTREQWLEAAVEALRPLFAEIDVELPTVRVSVGWPSKGGTRSKGKVIGQCWKGSVAFDNNPQIFISPILRPTSPIEVLGVLVHELIHAVDDCESGHRGAFRKMAKAIGLRGKMTATVVEEDSDLHASLLQVIRQIGTYPHSGLQFEEMEKAAGKQSTRMLKVECPADGYIVRTTAKWLDSMGTPTCPCGTEMEVA